MVPTANLAALIPATWGGLISAKAMAIPLAVTLGAGIVAGNIIMVHPASTQVSSDPPKAAAIAAAAPVAEPSAPAVPAIAARPCEAQTWPYIDAKCLSGAPQDKRVRVVNAARADEAVSARPGPFDLATRDTVLRQPQTPEALPGSEAAPAPRAKQHDARRKRGARTRTAQPYEMRGGAPVIVVRPLRLEAFR